MSGGRGSRARLLCATLALATLGMRYPPPHELGHVVLDQRARKAGLPPVAFDHFRHRAAFTCRVCHVDVGFAMTAGATGVSATTNASGYHCGACHDGKRTYRGRTIFPACDGTKTLPPGGACRRCHAPEDAARLRAAYGTFAAQLPRNGHGAVDWERAEAQGRVKPLDVLEGVSLPRPPLTMNRDVAISAEASWVKNIIFSHRKHSVWNGCEVCHPDIFPATRAGEVKYTMFQISSGAYCGACHDKVAFPLADCEGCHRNQVR